MADLFSNNNAKSLMYEKHILFLGDSNTRAQYKDLVWLLNRNSLITAQTLRTKLEKSYLGDLLVAGSHLHHGRSFQEVRYYQDKMNKTTVEYRFIPRCYSADLEDLFNCFKRGSKVVPNIIVINSCLWDLTRWGPNGVPQYKDNMVKLMRLLTQSLPKECLVIWTTTLPTAAHISGGLIIKQIEFVQPLMRFEVMEANTFARELVVSHGFDVLDYHFFMRMQMHRRVKDGVHYNHVAVRLLTNLLLTHLSLSWDVALPGNVSSVLLDKALAQVCKPSETETPAKIPTTGIFAKINLTSPNVPKSKGLKITFNNQDSVETVRRCNLFGKESLGMQQTMQNRPMAPQRIGHYPSFGFNGSYYYQGQNAVAMPRHWDQQPVFAALPAQTNTPGPYRQCNNNKKKRNKRKNPYRNNRYY